MRYAGVFEAVAIRKSGYPFRMTLLRFTHWFKCLLLPRTNKGYTPSRTFKLAAFESADPRERAQQILTHTGQLWANVQIGKSLILYRAEEHRLLELLRSLALSVLVPYLQRIARGHLARECRRRCIQRQEPYKGVNRRHVPAGVRCGRERARQANGRIREALLSLHQGDQTVTHIAIRLRRVGQARARVRSGACKYVIADDENEEEALRCRVCNDTCGAVTRGCRHEMHAFQLEIYGHARSIVDASGGKVGADGGGGAVVIGQAKMET